MIIPFMNSMSLVDIGVSLALVDEGSFRLGWPGAPGWMTDGCDLGSVC